MVPTARSATVCSAHVDGASSVIEYCCTRPTPPLVVSGDGKRDASHRAVGGHSAPVSRTTPRTDRLGPAKPAALQRRVTTARLHTERGNRYLPRWAVKAARERLFCCHETIYQALYHGGTRGLSRQLTVKLRTGRPLRKRRRRADERSPRFVAPALLIDQRPDVVEQRTRIGDWEGDLITGRLNGSAIGTVVDRASRYVQLIHLPDGRRADHLRAGLVDTMGDLPVEARRTPDMGSGLGDGLPRPARRAVRRRRLLRLPRPTMGARPQREHQRSPAPVLPKRTDLSIHTAADLRAVEQRLNGRPRKVLGWRTPAESSAPAYAPPDTECCDDTIAPSNLPDAKGSKFSRP